MCDTFDDLEIVCESLLCSLFFFFSSLFVRINVIINGLNNNFAVNYLMMLSRDLKGLRFWDLKALCFRILQQHTILGFGGY